MVSSPPHGSLWPGDPRRWLLLLISRPCNSCTASNENGLLWRPIGYRLSAIGYFRVSTLISLLLALFLAVPIACADSLFNDSTQPRPQGGGAGAAGDSSSSGAPELPAMLTGYAELPPPLLLAARSRAALPYATPQQQQGPQTDPNNPLAWIS